MNLYRNHFVSRVLLRLPLSFGGHLVAVMAEDA
jgi:hypothetical protein